MQKLAVVEGTLKKDANSKSFVRDSNTGIVRHGSPVTNVNQSMFNFPVHDGAVNKVTRNNTLMGSPNLEHSINFGS